MTNTAWPTISDDALVERLIPAIQRAIVTVSAGDQEVAIGEELTWIHGPETANALLMILATLLEQSPACSTPRGIRLLADAAGKELAQLIRETLELKQATLN